MGTEAGLRNSLAQSKKNIWSLITKKELAHTCSSSELLSSESLSFLTATGADLGVVTTGFFVVASSSELLSSEDSFLPLAALPLAFPFVTLDSTAFFLAAGSSSELSESRKKIRLKNNE